MPKPEGYVLRAFRNLPQKARTGIYGGKRVDVANRVSSEYEVRSRKWVKPNVQRVLLYSQALGEKIKLPVTTSALKSIESAGGLDRYLLNTPDALLHSDVASKLKFRLSSIYWHKQYQERQQQQKQRQQSPRLGSGQSQLAAVQAAQQQALAAGGTSLQRSWSSAAGGFLPPAAAAAAAAAAARSQGS